MRVLNALCKTIAVVCMVLLLLSTMGSLAVNADASMVRNRKIVSIVYDDSGSMMDAKWEYTNYAMQCFAAMLNEEDRLDITYMSSYEIGSVSVDTGDRAGAVKKIREHQDSSGTPLESVDTAFETLKSHNDSNANTQYWLIVITDGAMVGSMTTEQKINTLADKKMPNGTKPRIVFLTIGDVTNSFTPSFSKSNITGKSAKTASEIVDVISGIACDVSGRYAVDSADIRVVDGKTLEVTTDLPLIKMGILTQRSPAKVVKVGDVEGQSLKEDCNIEVAAPGFYKDMISDEDFAMLNGHIALYSAVNGNMAAGTYTITFSEEISKDDVVIMFEPAFELRLEVYVDGDRIDDPSLLSENTVVNIQATLYEIGTDNAILSSMLPSGSVSTISLSEDGVETYKENDLLLEDITLKSVENRAEASMEIPGFFTVRSVLSFRPTTVMLSDMTAEIRYDGSERRVDKNGVADGNNVVYITDLDKNGTGVKFVLYIDGNPIDKAQASSIKNDFAKQLDLDFNNFTVQVCDDGSLVAVPSKTCTPALIYWLFHRGDSVITATYGGKSASETVCFKMGDWKAAIIEFLIWLAVLWLIIRTLLWIFVKKHFSNGEIQVYKSTGVRAPWTQLYGFDGDIHWLAASDILNFFGLRGMRKKLGTPDMSVRASSGGYILENVRGCYTSTSIPHPGPAMGAPCQTNSESFTDTIYVRDGTNTYYKIIVVQ